MATAAEKEVNENLLDQTLEPSKILQFFSGTSVFLTGATGFVGKLLLEKLLRTCRDIKRVYVLVRLKKEKNVSDRLQELLDTVLFERLKREQPTFADKITIVLGDCVLPNLGISTEDRQKLIDDVSCVFHCAATVRFDQKIRTAAHINVRATRDLLAMSREMKHLKSFVYVSTAYSNCVREEIGEEFYEPTITGENLIQLLETINDDILDKITPLLLGDWPNTYVFTKAVAEEMVKSHSKDLPVVMVRPSVLIGTVKEPVAGFIDNFYGATGVFVGAALGLIRTLYCDKDVVADMVPADFFINCTIAAAWDISTKKNPTESGVLKENKVEFEEKIENNIPPVYNFISSNNLRLTWGQVMSVVEKNLKKIPSTLQVWHYYLKLNSSYAVHWLFLVFLHRLPAYIVDFLARCIGKEPMMVEGYKKIEKFMDVLGYFTTRNWRFRNDNTVKLWKRLNLEDQKYFDFDLSALDWDSYFETYAKGGRVYLMKDPLDTLPQGRIKYRKLQIAHYALMGMLLLGLYKILMMILGVIF